MEERKDYYIYAHIDKKTGLPFYVGKGTKRRANSFSSRNSTWKEIYNELNGQVSVEIVADNLSETQALRLEQYFIYGLIGEGIELSNATAFISIRTEQIKDNVDSSPVWEKIKKRILLPDEEIEEKYSHISQLTKKGKERLLNQYDGFQTEYSTLLIQLSKEIDFEEFEESAIGLAIEDFTDKLNQWFEDFTLEIITTRELYDAILETEEFLAEDLKYASFDRDECNHITNLVEFIQSQTKVLLAQF